MGCIMSLSPDLVVGWPKVLRFGDCANIVHACGMLGAIRAARVSGRVRFPPVEMTVTFPRRLIALMRQIKAVEYGGNACLVERQGKAFGVNHRVFLSPDLGRVLCPGESYAYEEALVVPELVGEGIKGR